MTQVLIYLGLGSALGITVLAYACNVASGRKREAWEDDEQASILAEDTRAQFVASSKSAVSLSH
jgi:hypothetical protein